MGELLEGLDVRQVGVGNVDVREIGQPHQGGHVGDPVHEQLHVPQFLELGQGGDVRELVVRQDQHLQMGQIAEHLQILVGQIVVPQIQGHKVGAVLQLLDIPLVQPLGGLDALVEGVAVIALGVLGGGLGGEGQGVRPEDVGAQVNVPDELHAGAAAHELLHGFVGQAAVAHDQLLQIGELVHVLKDLLQGGDGRLADVQLLQGVLHGLIKDGDLADESGFRMGGGELGQRGLPVSLPGQIDPLQGEEGAQQRQKLGRVSLDVPQIQLPGVRLRRLSQQRHLLQEGQPGAGVQDGQKVLQGELGAVKIRLTKLL